jgi:holliday junction DNA helicase RuvA
MIALVTGMVAVRRSDYVIVDCGGVGYRLSVSSETLRHVPAIGNRVTLHTHLIPRDDALLLYGFAGEEERDLFLMLLSVQAVGPKVALAVLSGGTPRELISALAAGDAARFQTVPGIGKRTAEAGEPIVARRGEGHPRTLARDGLLELGYTPGEAEDLLRDAAGESAEELIAEALRLARAGP